MSKFKVPSGYKDRLTADIVKPATSPEIIAFLESNRCINVKQSEYAALDARYLLFSLDANNKCVSYSEVPVFNDDMTLCLMPSYENSLSLYILDELGSYQVLELTKYLDDPFESSSLRIAIDFDRIDYLIQILKRIDSIGKKEEKA